ncbi:unnamed protein product [Auanema sp. JU1783]|nr:unnamed protein product [Auanema sp. JU1783]
MSILSEILATGHVDKELLDALDDEQKQLLFCQMRAEQVRKWEAFEERMKGPPKRDPNKRRLQWRQGTDGDVWVWVMGEHPSDPSIEEILEDEARREAHQRAIRELTLPTSNDHFTAIPQEEALKAQLGNMRVGVTDSMYENADNAFDSNYPMLFQPPHLRANGNDPNQPIVTKVSSYNTPQPQRAEVRPARPSIPPKPQTPNQNTQYELIGDNNVIDVKFRNNNPSASKDEDVQKRESEIFQSIQEKRERINREAEAEAQRQRMEWELQNKRAREAEAAMREMAQKAREQHQLLIRTSTSILPALKDTKATSLREAIRNLPRPPKPKSRQAIVTWFRGTELPKGTGMDPKTKAPAPWFHGIITRDQAEVLLLDKPTGSFLVRVSERIWGYTVSYVVGDGTFKHFLVERIPEGYQFLGTNQVVHEHLFDLVSYHESAPITGKGGEILKWAVGQGKTYPPDYYDLLPEQSAQNRYVGRF